MEGIDARREDIERVARQVDEARAGKQPGERGDASGVERRFQDKALVAAGELEALDQPEVGRLPRLPFGGRRLGEIEIVQVVEAMAGKRQLAIRRAHAAVEDGELVFLGRS